MLSHAKLLAALAAGFVVSGSASAAAMVPGFDSHTAVSADQVISYETIGFPILAASPDDIISEQIYISSRGFMSFSISMQSGTHVYMDISPFFDIAGYSGTMTYGTGTYDGNRAFGVNWVDISPDPNWFDTETGTGYTGSERNNFQLILVDRSDGAGRATGDFDIIFNYDSIQWDWQGPDFIGFSMLVNNEPDQSERLSFPHFSVYPGYFHDGQPNALVSNSLNSDVAGRYIFEVHSPIPEPETWVMLLAGLGIVGAVTRRQRIEAAL
ncbi:MAG: PEPxxWA-CTERM sorting domain-containing protein [Azoarcus sp.]|nr:PEPxxWA-CTERM sorting domain-containing protein [Azoarcus sp.]